MIANDFGVSVVPQNIKLTGPHNFTVSDLFRYFTQGLKHDNYWLYTLYINVLKYGYIPTRYKKPRWLGLHRSRKRQDSRQANKD